VKTAWAQLACQSGAAVAVFAMVACAGAPNVKSAREITATQLKARLCSPDGHYSTMFSGVSYSGSDSRFDYIVLAFGDARLRKYEMFKVKAGDLGLNYQMSLRSNPVDWIDINAHFPESNCH
jgi:hypothetical protein